MLSIRSDKSFASYAACDSLKNEESVMLLSLKMIRLRHSKVPAVLLSRDHQLYAQDKRYNLGNNLVVLGALLPSCIDLYQLVPR